MLLPLPFDITVHFLHNSTCSFKKISEICKKRRVFPYQGTKRDRTDNISRFFTLKERPYLQK